MKVSWALGFFSKPALYLDYFFNIEDHCGPLIEQVCNMLQETLVLL